MYTETNQLLREFLGTDEITVVIPFIYELGEELPTSNNEATLDNVIDEVRLELDEGIINSVDANVELIDFHNSWDLLMEVVDKIESELPDGSIITIEYNNCLIPILDDEEPFTIQTSGRGKFEAVYKACVEYVKYITF